MSSRERGAGRTGAVLPAALLLLLGGTMLAASLLVAARSAVLLSDGDYRLARALAHAPPSEDDGAEPSAGGQWMLPGGFRLDEGPVEEAAWSTWTVTWRVDPELVAAGLRGAVESAGGVVEGTDRISGLPDCGPRPLEGEWRIGPDLPPAPDPVLASHPRLGPVASVELARRAELEMDDGDPLPGGGPRLILASDGARITGGEGLGALVAEGSLRLGGSAVFHGLVLVGSDMVLEEDATVFGAVRAGGEVHIREGSRVLGCRSAVAAQLGEVAALRGAFKVPGGAFLGRH